MILHDLLLILKIYISKSRKKGNLKLETLMNIIINVKEIGGNIATTTKKVDRCTKMLELTDRKLVVWKTPKWKVIKMFLYSTKSVLIYIKENDKI